MPIDIGTIRTTDIAQQVMSLLVADFSVPTRHGWMLKLQRHPFLTTDSERLRRQCAKRYLAERDGKLWMRYRHKKCLICRAIWHCAQRRNMAARALHALWNGNRCWYVLLIKPLVKLKVVPKDAAGDGHKIYTMIDGAFKRHCLSPVAEQ